MWRRSRRWTSRGGGTRGTRCRSVRSATSRRQTSARLTRRTFTDSLPARASCCGAASPCTPPHWARCAAAGASGMRWTARRAPWPACGGPTGRGPQQHARVPSRRDAAGDLRRSWPVQQHRCIPSFHQHHQQHATSAIGAPARATALIPSCSLRMRVPQRHADVRAALFPCSARCSRLHRCVVRSRSGRHPRPVVRFQLRCERIEGHAPHGAAEPRRGGIRRAARAAPVWTAGLVRGQELEPARRACPARRAVVDGLTVGGLQVRVRGALQVSQHGRGRRRRGGARRVRARTERQAPEGCRELGRSAGARQGAHACGSEALRRCGELPRTASTLPRCVCAACRGCRVPLGFGMPSQPVLHPAGRRRRGFGADLSQR